MLPTFYILHIRGHILFPKILEYNNEVYLFFQRRWKERNALFNNAFNTIYLWLNGIEHMVNNPSYCHFQLAAKNILYAPSYRQDSTYLSLGFSRRYPSNDPVVLKLRYTYHERTRGVCKQIPIMVDAKNIYNICTEGHLKNDNHPCPSLKNGPEPFYKL